ncbi:alpha-hydroxy acid oxidase [Comamonas sp. w2-DMI]|uniref:alpha-hydroxy acid oxidase n=1 Tax=Comamonas sp. w2-DMI TaxID=3126391 RepID=UPI0032E52201
MNSTPLNTLGTPVEPPLQRIPADIASLADYARRAQKHIEAHAWAHIESGAEQGLTLTRNRAALEQLLLLPEPLADLSRASTAQMLLGQRLEWPVLLAPVAYQRLAHPEGELAGARAAMAMRTAMVVSTLSSYSLEDIAQAACGAAAELGRRAPLWFQLYSQPERQHTLALVRRAEAAGYQALMWTVDASIKRSSYPLPAGVEAANLRGMPQARQTSDLMSEHILFGTPLAAQAPGWDELQWLRGQTQLPLIVKGILSPRAARRALELGADALVVSNHGGRVLDSAVSPVEVLADIRTAVGPDMPLLLDGGIRQGTDVFKALALGANAVMIGRPQFHGLAVAGMLGMAHMLHALRAEFELAMAQMGCARLEEISADSLRRTA